MSKDKLWLLAGIVMVASLVFACAMVGCLLAGMVFERQPGGAGEVGANNTPLASPANTPVPPVRDTPSAVTSSCLPPPPGLIIWLPGDGNTDNISRQTYGLANGGIAFVSGKVGQAFDFNGIDSFIALPDADETQNLDGFSELTIQAWIKPEKVKSVAIVTKYDSRLPSGVSYFLDIEEGRLRLGIYRGMAPRSGSNYKSTEAVMSPGTFAHVTGVWEGGTDFALYVNGVEGPGSLDIDKVAPTQMADNDVPVNVGRFQSSSGSIVGPFGFFDGVIDEVSVYDRALTASEIQEVFAADQAGMCKSP